MNTENARELLYDHDSNPTAKYKAYLKYQDAYKDKVSKQNDMYNDALLNPQKLRMWPITGKEYSDDVKDAMNKWTVMGFKHEIESALNILNAQGFDMDTITQKNT